MIFKPISDLVQLDQSKISDSMLLVRSGAENDAKDYKLTISNLISSIKSEESRNSISFGNDFSIENISGNLILRKGQLLKSDLILTNESFNNDRLISFTEIYCPAIYISYATGQTSESPNALLDFGLTTPYPILLVPDDSKEVYINYLKMRVRSANGAAILVEGNRETTTQNFQYYDFSQETEIIKDGQLVKSNAIPNYQVSFKYPNQIRIRTYFWNNLRYQHTRQAGEAVENPINPSHLTLLMDDIPCTVTATVKIGMKNR